MLESQAGTGPDLGFVTGRKFNGKTGRDGLRDVGLQQRAGDGTQVHAGVFFGTVRVLRENGVGVELANAEFHWDA